MSPGSKRASTRAKRILFIASIAIAGAVAGCDNGQNEADKHVRQQLSDARVDAATGQVDAARQKREEAAKDGSASGGVRAAAKSAVAQDQVAIADELSGRIDRSELDVVRLVSEISSLTEQIRSGGTVAAGYKQLDPKPALDKIAADIAAAEGGADKPAWFTNDQGATIPTLAAVKQQLAQLETQINAQQEQINNLTQQRQRVLDDAEKAAADADQLKGTESVEAFKKASDLRKQAGDLSVQIDKAQTAITHLKASVATAQAQQQAVSDTINQLKDQSATIEKAWKDIDARVAAQRQLASKILGDSPASSAANPSSTVAQKAAELAKVVDEIKKMRADALAALNSAVTLFDDANKAATEYSVQLNTLISQSPPGRPEVDAWKQMREVMDPAQFRLRQAGALRKLGSVQASNAASLRARIALQQALTAAIQANDLRTNVAVVDATAVQERGASIAAAEAAYKQANEILSSIVDTMSPSPAKDRVLISRALTSYAYAQLLRQKGDPNQEPLKGSIATLINSAKADRDLAAEHNPNLPSMPAELGAPPKPAAAPAEPAATPASEPATAPSAVNPADSPEQAAVRAVMAKFVAAMENGDGAAAKALMQIETGQEAFVDQLVQLPVAMKRVETAMTNKFGKAGNQSESEGKFTFGPSKSTGDVTKAKIQVNGDTAVIDDKEDETMNKLTRVNGEWKFVIGAPKDEKETKARGALVQLISGMSTLASDIEAGKYAKAEDAGMAMMGMIFQAAASSGSMTGTAQSGAPAAPTPGPQ